MRWLTLFRRSRVTESVTPPVPTEPARVMAARRAAIARAAELEKVRDIRAFYRLDEKVRGL